MVLVDKEFMDRVTDLAGEHLESFAGLLIKMMPGKPNRWGVGHGLVVDGVKYRYQFLVAKEGTSEYQAMQDEYLQAKSEGGENP